MKTQRKPCRFLLPSSAAFTVLLFVTSFGILYAQVPAGPNRPAGVPDGYMITPSGYSHPSCLIELAKGDILLEDGRGIQHADGGIKKINPCAYPNYTTSGRIIVAGSGTEEPPELSGDQWVEDANLTTNTSYGGIKATWIVPPAPLSNDGQTVLLFPALSGALTIIQPVLGWNAGSAAPQWSIASWNCCYNGNKVYSAHLNVNSGDTIQGTIQSVCSAGTLSCSGWNITTLDVTSGQSSELTSTSSYGQTFNVADSGVLEVYNVVQCSDYSPNGGVSFSDVALYDYNFNEISNPNWGTGIDVVGMTPQCAYGVQVAPTQVKLFAGAPEALTVNVSGNGTVTSSPAGIWSCPGSTCSFVGISCPGTCSATFSQGTPVTLSASPASGYKFTGWSGACAGTGTCTVEMAAAESVTAIFALPTFSISPISTSMPLSLGHTRNYTFNVSALNEFTGTVALSAGGLPTGVTGSFSPSSINLTSANAFGTTTLTLTAAYSNSTYTGGSTGQTGAQTGVTVTGTSVSSTDSIVFDLNTRPLQYRGYCGVQ
jgi:hypothetical protein